MSIKMYDSYNNIPMNTFGNDKKRIQYEYFKNYIYNLSEDELSKERQVNNVEASYFYKCDHDSFDYKSYRILLQDRYIQVKVLSRYFSVF